MPTLLVIDDDPDILMVFRAAFARPDVTLLTASSAAEGLAKLDERRPDVVVLDIQLPDDSGLATFRRLHERDPRIPVLFITSLRESTTAIEAMRLGAYEYLVKPLDLDRARELIESAFKISHMMAT